MSNIMSITEVNQLKREINQLRKKTKTNKCRRDSQKEIKLLAAALKYIRF